MRTFFMLYVVPYEVLCHCERSVAISRKGTVLPLASDVAYAAMLLTQRCCLRSDVAYATMCAFGTICAKHFAI